MIHEPSEGEESLVGSRRVGSGPVGQGDTGPGTGLFHAFARSRDRLRLRGTRLAHGETAAEVFCCGNRSTDVLPRPGSLRREMRPQLASTMRKQEGG